jgi:hypothetical protein
MKQSHKTPIILSSYDNILYIINDVKISDMDNISIDGSTFTFVVSNIKGTLEAVSLLHKFFVPKDGKCVIVTDVVSIPIKDRSNNDRELLVIYPTTAEKCDETILQNHMQKRVLKSFVAQDMFPDDALIKHFIYRNPKLFEKYRINVDTIEALPVIQEEFGDEKLRFVIPEKYKTVYEWESAEGNKNMEEFYKNLPLNEKYTDNITAGWYGFSIGTPTPFVWLQLIDKITEKLVELDPYLHIQQVKLKFGAINYYAESAIISDLHKVSQLISSRLYDKRLIF